jgi:hypothetical protein
VFIKFSQVGIPSLDILRTRLVASEAGQVTIHEDSSDHAPCGVEAKIPKGFGFRVASALGAFPTAFGCHPAHHSHLLPSLVRWLLGDYDLHGFASLWLGASTSALLLLIPEGEAGEEVAVVDFEGGFGFVGEFSDGAEDSGEGAGEIVAGNDAAWDYGEAGGAELGEGALVFVGGVEIDPVEGGVGLGLQPGYAVGGVGEDSIERIKNPAHDSHVHRAHVASVLVAGGNFPLEEIYEVEALRLDNVEDLAGEVAAEDSDLGSD